ncbi:zinc ABC transporter permease [Cutibacterium equinum]|uniref:Zinc ABC transporter permease n=1 Tax=Cutibacterium equinum TaxID=3016342 RepID=A0ABY7QYK8_9ACTN|nr:zinc ABC transporter permease [Cutibacterium equinum]WCC80123.1 zinc ABC transporter permease [Cutibacterium equinum]
MRAEQGSSTLGVKARQAAERIGSIRLPDFLLGMTFVLGRYEIGLPMPIDVALTAGAIAVCAFVRPTVKVRGLGFYALLWAFLLLWVVGVSIHQGQPWAQRSFRWLLLILFSVCLAQGRLLWRSFVAGYAISLIFINIPANFTPLRSPGYEGLLLGFLGDKNVAGMVYAVVGILVLAVVRTTISRVLVFLVFSAALFATGSRTSMMAFAAGCVWVFIRSRLALTFRLLLVLVGWLGIRYVEDNFAEVGVFSDRAGTDWFRETINVATAAKIQASPWYGSGLGTAWVYVLDDRRMLFHDSYAALRVESGIPLLVAVVGLFLFVVWGLADQRTVVSDEQRVVEGAAVAILVCAWKLGEVFFTVPAFIVIGISLCERYGSAFASESETLRSVPPRRNSDVLSLVGPRSQT